MEAYWNKRPLPASDDDEPSISAPNTQAGDSSGPIIEEPESEYDRYRRELLERSNPADFEEGWESELRRYLKKFFKEVTKDTDLVEWWSVRHSSYQQITHYMMLFATEISYSP